MSALSSSFAEMLSKRVADLLSVPVVITNDQNQVIASSCPEGATVSPEEVIASNPDRQLAIPLELDGAVGRIVLGPSTHGEIISPRLANAAVGLLIDEAAIVERLQDQHDIKNRFIRDLLRGQFEDEESLLGQARFLGMDLTPPRAAIVIDASEYMIPSPHNRRPIVDETPVERKAQLIIENVVRFFHLPDDTICAYIGDGEVVVLKASNTKNLAIWADRPDAMDETGSSWANLTALKRASSALLARLQSETDASINIGVGRFHPGLTGLAESYQDAKAALSLGRRLQGRNHVYCLDELGIAAFVGISDEQTKIDLATHLLTPLNREPEIVETLQVFFANNCSPSPSAQQLAIHRNTLRYRLEKTACLIGLDPRRFDDAVVIRLSLMLRALHSPKETTSAPAFQ